MQYTITDKTLLLLHNDKLTKIYEDNQIINLPEDTTSIISNNCIYNGSTLEGRQQASSFLIGSSYKPPIVLDNSSNLILVPTHSTRNKSCAWVNLSTILNYKSHKKGILVEFRNNQKVFLNVSYNVFDKQVLRATRLESALRGRNNKKFL